MATERNLPMTVAAFDERLAELVEGGDWPAMMLDLYLKTRKHTLSTLDPTTHKTHKAQIKAEFDYLKGELVELELAIQDGSQRDQLYEVADVIIAATALLVIMGVSPRDALYLKTMKDQDRG